MLLLELSVVRGSCVLAQPCERSQPSERLPGEEGTLRVKREEPAGVRSNGAPTTFLEDAGEPAHGHSEPAGFPREPLLGDGELPRGDCRRAAEFVGEPRAMACPVLVADIGV